MRISQYSYDAPRLLAYLKQIFKARPFRMKRDDWNELKSTFRLNNNGFDELVNTPLSETPNVIGCLVKEIIPNKFEIKLYRFDSKDPKPYNVDVYHVFESITSMENIYYYIKQASTDYDDNMKRVDTHPHFIQPISIQEETTLVFITFIFKQSSSLKGVNS